MNPVVSPEDDYLGEHHVYEPHRVGLPRFGPYFRELWRRRAFATELAHTKMDAANTETVLGQLWLVLNPMLLASVYYLLVSVISAGRHDGMDYLAHITAGLFAFYFVSTSMTTGAQAVLSSGRLIMNTPFPKMLLTLSTTYTALRRFLPTMVVYLAIHLAADRPLGMVLLLLLPIFLLMALFALGLANVLATLQVYFRDTSSFLPYFVRIWLYVSPVLLTADQIRDKFRGLHVLNPLYSLLGAWTDVLDEGKVPSLDLWLQAVGWSLGVFVLGSLLFMSRERDFAVRL
ncbi:MAG TPA: ABC transporter permease [Mycobacteriales bacterium]|nr:ABC transporter permease [Mycobacteriales bacterium]